MNRKVFFILLAISTLFSCGGRERNDESNGATIGDSTIVSAQTSFNLFIENSGSMAGYCNISNPNALETLIGDWYDRINENSSEGDNITLNFVNTIIDKFKLDKNSFLRSTKSKCTATYTKIDDMLRMMMENVTDNDVNIMVSDFVFTTDNGNYLAASSQITSLFAKQLKFKKDLGVAIFKYMVDFNGKYYPGGLKCQKPLPIYVWVFGKDINVKKITNLSFNSVNCGEYYLQLSQHPSYKIVSKNKRMIKDNSIIVSKWNPVRHKNYYEFQVIIDLSTSLLKESDIKIMDNYAIETQTASVYSIAAIESLGNNQYSYTIRTTRPSPGSIILQYPSKTPVWVESSNYTGSGIPNDSTSLGIKYLVGGVSKAFRDASGGMLNYFDIILNLQQ